jgi:Protein of unknown function (DUF2612)
MTNLEQLIEILSAPFQRLDEAAVQVRDGYDVDTAIGVQLDVLGKLVNQKRDGHLDDVYRRYIRARIAVNKSSGKHEELLNIARLVLGSTDGNVWIRTRGNAEMILEVHDLPCDDDTAAALVEMVGSAVSAGVRVCVVTSRRALSSMFRFDSGLGYDQGHYAGGDDNESAD